MTPEELAEKHFKYNTSCPMKRKRIDYQRELLVKDIKSHFMPVSSTLLSQGTDIVFHYSPKKESK